MIALVSFATDAFLGAQAILAESALNFGVDQLAMWRAEDLWRTDFYQRRKGILDQPRGAGYWLWKPYIILRELQKLGDGDVLIYYDCGRPEKPHRFKRPIEPLVEWCRSETDGMLPGVYAPQYGPNRRWTKGECFRVMGCEGALFRDHPQVQATFSIWQKHEASLDFVREWLAWCEVPAALLDDHIDPRVPDAPDFRQHRHDQSILTLLTLKHGMKCYGDPWQQAGRTKNINALVERVTGEAEVETFSPDAWGKGAETAASRVETSPR